jgi:hypothetical protein
LFQISFFEINFLATSKISAAKVVKTQENSCCLSISFSSSKSGENHGKQLIFTNFEWTTIETSWFR